MMNERKMNLKIIFWGTGNVACKFIKTHTLFMQASDIVGFTDSDENKWGTFFVGYSVICPDVILHKEYDYILILSSYYDEIKKSLVEDYAVSHLKIISIDEAYQIYMRKNHGEENSFHSDFKSEIAGFTFSQYMYERMSEGIDNMFAYLYIKDKFAEIIEKFRIDLECDKTQIQVKALKKDTPIWVCWLQGIENAPDLVKCCINSITANVEGKIHLITYNNYSRYVKIDESILEKHKLGIISKTHFSDILRLALLCEYGGIWIDSTILFIDEGLLDYVYQLPIFMYRIRETLDAGYYDPRLFSNWLIKSEKGHPVVKTVYHILEEWWKTENVTPYFIFHYIMRLVWAVYANSENGTFNYQNRLVLYDNNCQTLIGLLNEKYDEVLWDMIKKVQPLQKLSYKREWKKENSFYEYILKKFGTGITDIKEVEEL